jgi:hypothetical protein
MNPAPVTRAWSFVILIAGLALFSTSAPAQSTMNAQITGGGGSGKCTFEVRVDGVANVQIRGNQGYLQTKQGMPAQWVRLRCNQPLPRNPNNFRFQGVDGHGKQYMLKNPSQNNGVAVIRIEDNRSGYEGYTGDIFWNGGSNNGGNGNNWWQDDWNGGGGWGNGNNNDWNNGNNNNNWNNGGGWSNKAVPNCQNAIRRKIQQDAGGATVNFKGSPSVNKAGSFVTVDGHGNGRANNGKQANFSYHCSMHPNGNVADASYNMNGAPQPR